MGNIYPVISINKMFIIYVHVNFQTFTAGIFYSYKP